MDVTVIKEHSDSVKIYGEISGPKPNINKVIWTGSIKKS